MFPHGATRFRSVFSRVPLGREGAAGIREHPLAKRIVPAHYEATRLA